MATHAVSGMRLQERLLWDALQFDLSAVFCICILYIIELRIQKLAEQFFRFVLNAEIELARLSHESASEHRLRRKEGDLASNVGSMRLE